MMRGKNENVVDRLQKDCEFHHFNSNYLNLPPDKKKCRFCLSQLRILNFVDWVQEIAFK